METKQWPLTVAEAVRCNKFMETKSLSILQVRHCVLVHAVVLLLYCAKKGHSTRHLCGLVILQHGLSCPHHFSNRCLCFPLDVRIVCYAVVQPYFQRVVWMVCSSSGASSTMERQRPVSSEHCWDPFATVTQRDAAVIFGCVRFHCLIAPKHIAFSGGLLESSSTS